MEDEENNFVFGFFFPCTFQCFHLLLIEWHVTEQEHASFSSLCLLTLLRATKFPVATVKAGHLNPSLISRLTNAEFLNEVRGGKGASLQGAQWDRKQQVSLASSRGD